MLAYFFPFLILSFFHFLEFFKNKRNIKFISIFAAVYILILFAGLRKVGVSPDDLNYYYMFTVESPSLNEWIFGNFTYDIKDLYMEPGYVFINSFLKLFTKDYTYLFLTLAFISVGIATYNYYRYSKYIFLSLLLFYVHTFLYRDMNQLRAAIASAIGLFLIVQIHKKEHLKVFITILILSTFHIASIVLFFAYLASFIKLTRKKALLLYIGAVAFGALGGISEVISHFIPESGFLAMKLYSYTTSEKYAAAVSLFDITNIKNSLVLFIVLINWNKLEKIVPYFKTIVLFYLIAVCIRIAFYDLSVIAARVSTFFAIVEVILIPYFIDLFKQKILISFIIILYALATLNLNIFVKNINEPYETSLFQGTI